MGSSLSSLLSRARHKYSPLHDDESQLPRGHHGRRNIWSYRDKQILKLTMALSFFAVLLGFALIKALAGPVPEETICDTPEKGFQCETSLSHTWGQYSPFFSVPSEIDPAVPEGCELTFAQVLSRHGARDPTLGKSILYGAMVSRIHDVVTDYGKGYEFIRDFDYTMGADQLTAFGQQQLVNSGIKFYQRYRSLVASEKDSAPLLPFVRASGQDRVIMSAVNFTHGFYSALLADGSTSAPPPPPSAADEMLIIPETNGLNNTLSHGLCTSFENGGNYSALGEAQAIWADVFTPAIIEKLNVNLPGANFSGPSDAVFMMDLCPFDSVSASYSPGSRPISPFCNLFTEDEWADYDYFQTIGKWYSYGPGNALGPTQGVGYVNELLARLTGKPVEDRTSVNRTLDSDPETFPLDRKLYADFGHDNDMTGVLGALRLYEGAIGKVSNTTRRSPAELGGFSAGWTVPFAGRVYFEKMKCGRPQNGGKKTDEELVRILVNDRVVPLVGCDADELGRCTLEKFVDSMEFARKGGRWDLCFN